MAENVFKLDGLIVGETGQSEADKLLSVLTAERGKLTVRAYGAKSYKSKLVGITRTLCYCRFDIKVTKNGQLTLTDATLLDGYAGLWNNLDAITVAQYVVQVANMLTFDGMPDEGMLPLTLDTLHVLDRTKNAAMVKACFELRAMTIAGYAPVLDECSHCHKPLEQNCREYGFDLSDGVLVCGDCLSHFSEDERRRHIVIPCGVYLAMRHIVGSELKRLFAFRLDADASEILCGLCERFLCEHLGYEPRSLSFCHTVFKMGKEK